MRISSSSLLVLLLPLSAAAAAASPSVALHRSEIVGDQSEQTEILHALVASELVRRGINLAPSDSVSAFFAARKDKSCMALDDAERAACLAELAKAVGADRSVVITIAPFVPRKIILSGVVVGHNGSVLQTLPAMEYPRTPNIRLEVMLEKALADFIPRLNVFDLSPEVAPLARSPSQVQPAETVAASAPAEASTAPASAVAIAPTTASGSGRRTFAIGSLIAGAAFVGLGSWQLIDSSSKYAAFEKAYGNGGRPTSETTAELGNAQAAARSRTIGAVGLGLGAVALGTGVYLLLTSNDAAAPQQAPSSTPTLLVGPTSVGVSVLLP